MTDCQIADSLRDRLETHYENAPEDAQPFTLGQIKNAGWGVFGLLIAEVLNGVELEQVRIALKDIAHKEYQYIKNNLSPIRCRTHPNAFKRLALSQPQPEKKKPFVPFKAVVLEDRPLDAPFMRGDTIEIIGRSDIHYHIFRHDGKSEFWVVQPEQVCPINDQPKPEPATPKRKPFLVVHRETKTLALVLETRFDTADGFQYRFDDDGNSWAPGTNYISITDSTMEARAFIKNAVDVDNLDRALRGELEA